MKTVAAIPPITAMMAMTVVRSGFLYNPSKIPGCACGFAVGSDVAVDVAAEALVFAASLDFGSGVFTGSFGFCLFCGANKCTSS